MSDLFGQLVSARQLSDSILSLSLARPEDLYARPIPERYRFIFYLGHLEAFDRNLICTCEPQAHRTFDKLFSFGIDPPPGELPNDQPSDWPSAQEVFDYNRAVRATVDRLWDRTPDQLRHVAIEHRLMHCETLAYMLHNIDRPRERVQIGSRKVENPFVEIPSGMATLGRENGFGWDNEFEQHEVWVPAFAISAHKVTNGEYLDFVNAGGPVPHFWMRQKEGWSWRGMFHTYPLPLDWPVFVTHSQASDYAEWKGKALPTEAEWHRAAEAADLISGNFGCLGWEPRAVQTPASAVSGLSGDAWEWTSTVFHPFDGFEPFPFYKGYSANFFDGQHYVLKGASMRTPSKLVRSSFRNWFRPDYPYMYAGFRLVER